MNDASAEEYSRKGKVLLLSPNETGCSIALDTSGSLVMPKDGIFVLMSGVEGHQNYSSVYALILASTINGFPVLIRTKSVIKDSEYGIVDYISFDIRS